MKKIQVAKPYFPEEDIERILKDIRSVFESGILMQNKFVKAFEESFARYVGVKHAVAVNSGMSALLGILSYFDIKDQEVLVPVNTFLATANAVLVCGGNPVFVEMDSASLCMDVEDFKSRITGKTKGVILVHLAGLIQPRIEEIRTICKEHGLFLIEDAAHAHGSSHNGQIAGSLGEAGAFSFLATKVLTSGGEGGIVTTDNEGLAKRVVSLRFHGEDDIRGIQGRVGYSWRMTEMQAIAGLAQVRRLNEIVEKRMEIAKTYDTAFSTLTRVSTVEVPKGDRVAYYKYPLILEESLKRQDVAKKLEDEFGIQTSVTYWPPCHLQPAYRKKFGYKEGDFPVAEDVLNRTISLPIFCDLTEKEIHRVIAGVQKVCG